MSAPQRSKRDRGRAHVGLPPKQEPKYGWCDLCGNPIHNRGAHTEACSGTRAEEALRAVDLPGTAVELLKEQAGSLSEGSPRVGDGTYSRRHEGASRTVAGEQGQPGGPNAVREPSLSDPVREQAEALGEGLPRVVGEAETAGPDAGLTGRTVVGGPSPSAPVFPNNRGAHGEACRGAPAGEALRTVAAHPHVCQARRPAAFGLYSHCVLPFAHSGEHHWSDEPSSRMGGDAA